MGTEKPQSPAPLSRAASGSSPVSVREVSPLLIERCREAALVLCGGLKLSLFGFDVIVPDSELGVGVSLPAAAVAQDSTNIVIIDVNFFPSYKEVKDFPSRLNAFLRRKAGLDPWDTSSSSSNSGAIAPVCI